MFITSYIYVVSYTAFLIKRVPKSFVPQVERTPGLVGRFLDARRFAGLAREEIMKQRWLKSPASLAFSLMASVHFTTFLAGFFIPAAIHLLLYGLNGANIITNTNSGVLLILDLTVILGGLLMAISLTIGFPFYRFTEWLKSENLYMRRLNAEELATTFDPPAKFRPRAIETLITLGIYGALMTGICVLFWAS